MVPIASVPGWTNELEWNKSPKQRSARVPLEVGKRYYIDVSVLQLPG